MCTSASPILHQPLAPIPCVCISCRIVPAAAAAAADAAFKGDLLNTSYYPSRADAANVTKRWYIIDAQGQTLGRLATLAATYVRCAGQAVWHVCWHERRGGGGCERLPARSCPWCVALPVSMFEQLFGLGGGGEQPSALL